MIVLVQTAVPAYRASFLSAVRARLPDLRVICGDDFVDEVTRTDWATVGLERVRNRFLFGRRLWFQTPVFRLAMEAEVAILEYNPRILSGWLVLCCRWLLRRPTALWGHAAGRDGRIGSGRVVMRALCDVLCVYTQREMQQLRGGPHGDKVLVATNSLYSRDLTYAEAQDTESARDIIFSGRLVGSKKPGLLLAAYALARPQLLADARLHFIGAGPEMEQLEREAARLGIADTVDFWGTQHDYDALKSLYARTLLSVSPGYAGLSVIQSLWFGVPVLVAEGEAHAPEVAACTEENSVSFAGNHAPGLARTLIDTFDSREIWMRRRASIREGTRAIYNIEVMADEWVEAARTALNHRPAWSWTRRP